MGYRIPNARDSHSGEIPKSRLQGEVEVAMEPLGAASEGVGMVGVHDWTDATTFGLVLLCFLSFWNQQ